MDIKEGRGRRLSGEGKYFYVLLGIEKGLCDKGINEFIQMSN